MDFLQVLKIRWLIDNDDTYIPLLIDELEHSVIIVRWVLQENGSFVKFLQSLDQQNFDFIFGQVAAHCLRRSVAAS